MLKRFGKALLTSFLALSLVACGGGKGDKKEEVKASKFPTPAANVDPSALHPGSIQSDENTSDFWFNQDDESEYMYLTYSIADNCPSGLSVDFVEGDGTEWHASSYISDNNHLVSVEGAEAEFDFMFYDVFKAYDNVSKHWYVRGDMDAYDKMFNDKTFAKEDGSESFHLASDGVMTRTYKGEEETGTWFIDATTVVSWIYDSDAYYEKADIYFNEDGSVAYLQIMSSVYYPQE